MPFRPISDNLRGALLMAGSMAAFTANDACMKAVAEHMPIFQAVTLRGLLTVVAILLIGRATGSLRLWLPRREAGIVGLRTAAELLATVFFLLALTRIPLANLSAILQALPLAVTLGAAVFFGEKVGWRRLTAIGVGFFGVMLIVRPGAEGFDIWSLAALASMAAVVLRDLTTRRLSAAVPSLTVALWAAAGVTAMGAVLSLDAPWRMPGVRELLLVLGATGGLIAGYLSIVSAVRIGEVGFVSPFRYTSLVCAVLLGWAAFGEIPDILTAVGAVIVVGSGLFTLWREQVVSRRKRQPAG